MSVSVSGTSSCLELGSYLPRIGIKLEFSNDIPLLHSNGPRKLASLIPRTCRTVRDVKSHIKDSWCSPNFPTQNLELLIGNYSLVDEDEVDIFMYYKGESVLVYRNSSPVTASSSAAMMHAIETYTRNFPLTSVSSIDNDSGDYAFQNESFATSSKIHCVSLPLSNAPTSLSQGQEETVDKLKTMHINNPDPDKKTRSARRRERWKRSLLKQLQEKEGANHIDINVPATISKGEKRKAGDADDTSMSGDFGSNKTRNSASSPNPKKPRSDKKSTNKILIGNASSGNISVEPMEVQNGQVQSDGDDSIYGTPPRSVRCIEQMEKEYVELVRDDCFYSNLNKIESNQLDVGSYIAFKLIELDEHGQPNLSSYKEAMVTEIVNNWVHLEYFKCNTTSQSFLEQYQVEGFDYGDELVNPKKVQLSNFYQLRACPKPPQGA